MTAKWWFRHRSDFLRHLGPALLGMIWACQAWGAQPVEPGTLAVVIFNSRVPESKAVADYYAQKRGVPPEQVLGLDLPTQEEITRAEFRILLQEPLFHWLVEKGLFSLGEPELESPLTNQVRRVVAARVRYAVLCYGVPLKIKEDAYLNEPLAGTVRATLRRNQAAVDSELVWLPGLRQNVRLTGVVTNRFYGTGVASQLQPTNGVLLIGRLDGPTPEIARGLVDKALQAERDGLWGRAYIDMRGIKEGDYKVGDEFMHGAAQACAAMGYDVAVDLSPETFPTEFPLSHVAIYAGWYSGKVCGPFARPEVEFMPGAFAYHLHSFSAATVRSREANWVGPLLAKGATITVGSVYEPYLSLTPEVAILLRNLLLLGSSFGEAAWSAEFGFSWQTTVIGDPLYRPACLSLVERQAHLEKIQSPLREWSEAMLADRELARHVPASQVAASLANLPLTRQSAVLSEKLAEVLRLQGDAPGAIAAYEQALTLHPSPQQKVRLYLALAGLQQKAGDDLRAIRTLQALLTACPDYPAPQAIWRQILPIARRLRDALIVNECEGQLNPKPAAPPHAPTPPGL